MLLQVAHISKSYPGLPVLHDISLDAADGEIICILGPSGCGKSSPGWKRPMPVGSCSTVRIWRTCRRIAGASD